MSAVGRVTYRDRRLWLQAVEVIRRALGAINQAACRTGTDVQDGTLEERRVQRVTVGHRSQLFCIVSSTHKHSAFTVNRTIAKRL